MCVFVHSFGYDGQCRETLLEAWHGVLQELQDSRKQEQQLDPCRPDVGVMMECVRKGEVYLTINLDTKCGHHFLHNLDMYLRKNIWIFGTENVINWAGSTLVLIGYGGTCTKFHVDWTEAINIAIAIGEVCLAFEF